MTKMNDFHKYDLIREYRDHPETLEHEQLVEHQILDFELQRQKEGATKRQILRSAAGLQTSA